MSLVETLILYVVVVSNYTLEILKDTIFSGRGEGASRTTTKQKLRKGV